MLKIFSYFTFIVESIFIQDYGFSSFLSHYKLSNIFVVILVDLSSKSAGPSIGPLAIIPHKFFSCFGAAIEYLDGSFAVSHAFLKISKINVFVWDILKAKTIFLALSRQINLPVAKVKSTTIVPDCVLAFVELIVETVFEFSGD